jgi:hypothetical protein
VKKFKALLVKRYKTLLPMLGAGLVLATFVVKETWREDLKDFVDAMDASVGVFVIRGDFENLEYQLRVLEQNVDRVEQVTASSTKDPFTLLAVNQQLMIFRELQDNVDNSLDNSFRLAQSFPDDRKTYYQNEVTTLRSDLSGVQTSFRDADVASARASARVGPDGVPGVEDRKSIASATTELSAKTTSVVTATQLLKKQILKEAGDIQDQKQHRYERLRPIWTRMAAWLNWKTPRLGCDCVRAV